MFHFIFFGFLCLVLCSIISSYVFSGTRRCYVLIVKSFVAFVSVLRPPPLRLVSFVAHLPAAPAAAATTITTLGTRAVRVLPRPAAAAAGLFPKALLQCVVAAAWPVCNMAQICSNALRNACLAYRTPARSRQLKLSYSLSCLLNPRQKCSRRKLVKRELFVNAFGFDLCEWVRVCVGVHECVYACVYVRLFTWRLAFMNRLR